MNQETKSVLYEIMQEKKNFEGKDYDVYGIVAYVVESDNKIKLDEVSDISSDINFVQELINKFNTFDLHIEHFHDVVYDFVYKEFSWWKEK